MPAFLSRTANIVSHAVGSGETSHEGEAVIKYKCGPCQKEFPKELLTAKRVQFRELGTDGRVLKSRVTAWLCPECLEADPEYHIVRYSGPGIAAKRIGLSD
jgi:hypothetical protein